MLDAVGLNGFSIVQKARLIRPEYIINFLDRAKMLKIGSSQKTDAVSRSLCLAEISE